MIGDVMTTTLNLEIEEYTNRLLGVIKEMFGLKNKSEALNKLADMCGEEFLEKKVKEEFVKDIIASSNAHIKKYGMRKMTIKELDKLSGVDE